MPVSISKIYKATHYDRFRRYFEHGSIQVKQNAKMLNVYTFNIITFDSPRVSLKIQGRDFRVRNNTIYCMNHNKIMISLIYN